MSTIRISDLSLRAIIGTNDWERKAKQDVVINVTIDFDATRPSRTDNIKDTVDYKTITKNIIGAVENSKFFLIERLAAAVLDIVMKDKKVRAAHVRIDKPAALRYARTVSVELSRLRKK